MRSRALPPRDSRHTSKPYRGQADPRTRQPPANRLADDRPAGRLAKVPIDGYSNSPALSTAPERLVRQELAACYPYTEKKVRSSVDTRAKITSKGQVTIPKSVRAALELHEGDELLFRVERSRAVIAKTPSFLQLAGTVPVPAEKRGTAWDDVLRQTRRQRAGRRH